MGNSTAKAYIPKLVAIQKNNGRRAKGFHSSLYAFCKITYTGLTTWLCQQVVDVRALFGDKRCVKLDLPIYAVTDDLIKALSAYKRAVLCAPPGAGKTTVVPIEMLKISGLNGRILMLEPRRLAARAAAERMAQILGEPE
jgi:hypothetical protein